MTVERHEYLPRCEHPWQHSQKRTDGYDGVIFRRCGKCVSCLDHRANIKAGLIDCEARFPLWERWEEPGWMHFITFTYNDQAIPWTEPVPHDLALNFSQTGPFKGHFCRMGPDGYYRPKRRVPFFDERSGRVARWSTQGFSLEYLTDDQVIQEQKNTLSRTYGWDYDQIREWETGSYAPTHTLHLKDMQDYFKRLRIWFSRHYPDLPMFRVAYTGEYGPGEGRPHYHMVIFGWPPETKAMTKMANSWAHYHDDSFMQPNTIELVNGTTSWLDKSRKATTYVTKDVAKSRRTERVTPSIAARREPFVIQSTKPALGVRAMLTWAGRDILPLVDGKGDSLEAILAIRRSREYYLFQPDKWQKPVGKDDFYTTSETWRNYIREEFDQEDWEYASQVLADEQDDKYQTALAASDDLEADHEQYREALREQNRANRLKAEERKRRAKALRQPAPGLRSF